MKPNILKPFNSLPKREQEVILKMMEDAFWDRLDREEVKLQKILLKLNCIVLSDDYFNLTTDDLLVYIGNQKRIYRQLSKFKTEEEQAAWIDERISEIFPDGYPSEFIDSLENL